MVGRALEELPPTHTAPRLLDPAAGAGVFLLEAFDALNARAAAASPEEEEATVRAHVLRACLWGVEIDPQARRLCVEALHRACPQVPRETIAHRITLGDALTPSAGMTTEERGSVDLFVANPPYGQVIGDARGALERRFPHVGALTDRAAAFVALAWERLRPGGRATLILPRALLDTPAHADLRGWLAAEAASVIVDDLGARPVFQGIATPTVVLSLTKDGGERLELGLVRLGKGQVRVDATRATRPLPTTGAPWRIEEARSSIHDRATRTLGELAEVRDVGLNYWTRGRGKRRGGSIAERVLYEGPRRADGDRPVLRGSDFEAFERATPGRRHLRADWTARLDPARDELRFSPAYLEVPWKLIYRQTATSLIVALDERGLLVDKSVHVITPRADGPELDPWFLMAWLNSAPVQRWYHRQADEAGRAFAQVKIYRTRRIPLPRACAAEERALAGLARSISARVTARSRSARALLETLERSAGLLDQPLSGDGRVRRRLREPDTHRALERRLAGRAEGDEIRAAATAHQAAAQRSSSEIAALFEELCDRSERLAPWKRRVADAPRGLSND